MLNSLNVALSGLYSSKTQVENVMNNIANENTVGYKKRVVDVKESEHNDSRMTGRGTTVEGVDRITNIYMYDNLIKEQSKNAEYSELSTMLSDIESIFFETETSGFSSNLDRFFQSIEDLRANPYNEIYRTNLINQGTILVDGIQSLYSNIEAREKIATNFIYDHIDEVNGILKDIGAVNQIIQDTLVPSNDLLDKRDLLESRLSEYMNLSVNRSESYSLEIGGVTAVRYNTNIHEVRVVDESILQKDVYATDLNVSNLVDLSTWDGSDTITYYFNKDHSITLENGVDGVTSANIVQKLVEKINEHPVMKNNVVAYNGQYSVDENGDKIPKSPSNIDHYLIVEAKVAGKTGDFEGRIIVSDDNNPTSNLVEKNSKKSIEAQDDIHLEIFDEEIPMESGKVKSILENIDTTSQNNKFTKYKEMLDNFAKALADISEAYIFQGEGQYVSGEEASLLNSNKASMKVIGLFEGTSVATLSFNSSVARSMSQADLDYLSTIHWNENVKIGNSAETSFAKYYQSIRITVSADKENVDYLKDTQEAVTESLKLTYDKLTKVDKDDEMVNLIKFQATNDSWNEAIKL